MSVPRWRDFWERVGRFETRIAVAAQILAKNLEAAQKVAITAKSPDGFVGGLAST
jgi:hypothetical protein